MASRTSRYRDTSGKALTDYPRPSVAVDTAVLTVSPDNQLCVLLVRRAGTHKHGTWQLPGTFLHPGETLGRAALRALADKAGINGLDPVQLAVFDDPDRDDRGWVLSVAHLDVVPWDRVAALGASLMESRCPVSHSSGLAFDHDRIVDLAVERLRAEYEESPTPAGCWTTRSPCSSCSDSTRPSPGNPTQGLLPAQHGTETRTDRRGARGRRRQTRPTLPTPRATTTARRAIVVESADRASNRGARLLGLSGANGSPMAGEGVNNHPSTATDFPGPLIA